MLFIKLEPNPGIFETGFFVTGSGEFSWQNYGIIWESYQILKKHRIKSGFCFKKWDHRGLYIVLVLHMVKLVLFCSDISHTLRPWSQPWIWCLICAFSLHIWVPRSLPSSADCTATAPLLPSSKLQLLLCRVKNVVRCTNFCWPFTVKARPFMKCHFKSGTI